ncbi:MAG TPA: tryptophan synthase subunit alpha [Gammaproteobacteria bacterium]|nr:tryptophan synthase subunit alpha [Gammaproteobacteria bacterium]
MSRIQSCFEALRRNHRKALIPFLTAGDPSPASTVPLMHTLVEAGADLIELGVPFSDPMADGPVIQRASERALKYGVSLHDVIGMTAEFRKTNAQTPVVLMGYLNPIEVMGYESFVEAAARAGVDGVLTVDLPPEEASSFVTLLRKQGVDPVFLLAPTTTEERAARICQASSGFVYYVSLKGVTGASGLNVSDVATRIRAIRKHTQLPIGVGFGVKDPATAAKLAEVADAVVVASALLSAMETVHADPAKLRQVVHGFVAGLRTAMDAA